MVTGLGVLYQNNFVPSTSLKPPLTTHCRGLLFSQVASFILQRKRWRSPTRPGDADWARLARLRPCCTLYRIGEARNRRCGCSDRYGGRADPLGRVSGWRRGRNVTEPAVETVHDGYLLFQRIPELARRGVTLTIVDTPEAGATPPERPWLLPISASFQFDQAPRTSKPLRRRLPPCVKVASRSLSSSIRSSLAAPA